MNNTYFTSDLHLSQRNILKDRSNWGFRDFHDEQEMDVAILEGINSTVGKHDTLYILGDFCFTKDMGHLQSMLNAFKCVNVVYILGNHDHLLRRHRYSLFSNRDIHDYLRINIKYPEEFQDPNRDKWAGQQSIILCHYAMRVWDRSHHGSWMLYGHSHDSLDNLHDQDGIRYMINSFYANKKTMDVGIDTAYRFFGEYRPFSFFEIKDIMDMKEELYIDHHEKRP